MEGGSEVNSNPNSNHFDKSRILDVKPLRSLRPVFPNNANQGLPFVCCPPFGSFSSGFSPFYPFGAPKTPHSTPDLNQTQNTPPSFVPPLRSFRTPTVSNGPSCSSGVGGTKRGPGRPKSVDSVKKKERKTVREDLTLSAVEGVESFVNFDSGISTAEREDGNRDIVINVLARFDSTKRRFSQLEDVKHANLKAAGSLMSRGIRTNMKKRVGTVPGVEVGDIFFFRIEMCLVGLHLQTMAGIDYIVVKGGVEEDPMATSIVSSGCYDDEAEDPDILIYSGQGGTADRNRRASDQKLERGNLALEKSLRRGNEVRVIRGVRDLTNPATKIYLYDGLFSIKESWVEKGKSGCNTFKYKLVRLPGQPPAFSVWKSVQKWREGLTTRAGLILPDLTSGAESLPVSLVNDVDDEKGPAYFTYSPALKYSESSKWTQSTVPCSCHNSCAPGNLDCSCVRRNGGDLPYVSGTLVSRKSLIYECGPSCPCHAKCKNKVIQTGLKVRLEVFKTANRGWGLRSWDPIRAGAFICEYAGEVKDKDKLKEDEEDDDYVFDTTRVYHPFKWNYEPALVDEEDTSEENSEEFDLPSPLMISAKNVGNVARFMNHSCSPNVLWQPVVYEHDSESFIHIAFFAIGHIPPMAELTYDYGVSRTNEAGGGSTSHGKKKCLCGSEKCRGSFA